MGISAEFSWKSEVSWFNWDSASSGLNSSELRFIKTMITKNKN